MSYGRCSKSFDFDRSTSSIISGVCLLWGTQLFLGRTFSRAWFYGAGVGILWIIVSISWGFPFILMSMPTFTFLAAVYIWTGITLIRSSRPGERETAITGWAFVIWGIHKGNYPFLRPVAWFAPWGYLIAAALELVAALGMLTAYFQKTRRSLQDSEEKFRLFFNAGPDATTINRLADGCYVDVNDGFTKAIGFTREETIGRTSKDINAWVDLSERAALIEKLKTGGFCDNFEARFRRKDGPLLTGLVSARGISLHGEPHAIFITRDITERNQAEAERERLIFAIEQASEIVAITDASGRIQYVNQALENITGYPSSEAVGKNPRFLKSGRHDRAFYNEMWDTILHGNPWTGRLINRRRDGTLYTGECSISPIRDNPPSCTRSP